jgi:hypothetical protein
MGFEGGEAAGVRDALLRGKEKEGIWSEVWAPIRFQEYVLGYVRLWTVRDGSPSLDDKAVEMVMAFTQFIAYALKEAGYFEGRRKANKPFVGTVIDMSASGLLFTYPVSYTGLALRPGAELGVTLETPRRIIRGGVRIVRRFLSLSGPVLKLGAAFRDLEGEDLRGLFEYLYEKPFTAGRMSFLAGRV